MATTREARIDLQREFRAAGEEKHYRSDLQPGDIVRGQYGNLSRLTGWNHTWSHLTGGRLAHLEPIVSYPGTPAPDGSVPYAFTSSWENNLTRAEPGDVGSHSVRGPVGMWQPRPASWS